MRCMHEFDTLRTCSLYSASAMLQFQRGDFEELGFGGAPQCFLSRSPRGLFRGHDEGNLIGRNNKRIGMKQTPGCAGTAGELPDRPLPSAPLTHTSRHRAIAPSRHRSPTRQAVRHVDPPRGHRHRHGTSRPTRCTHTQWGGVRSAPWAARASRAAPACR